MLEDEKIDLCNADTNCIAGANNTASPTMMKKPKRRLYHLDWLRSTSICMVVLTHTCQLATKPKNMPVWQLDRNDGVIKVLCTFGVTIFFYCGGMAQTFKRNRFDSFVWGRFKRLIVPFVFAVFLILLPTLFIICEYTRKVRKPLAIRSSIYPDTDPKWPEEGEYTSYNFGEFVQAWCRSLIEGSNALELFSWLWFLPLMFSTDIMSFAGSRWMQFSFEGGWFKKHRDSDMDSVSKSLDKPVCKSWYKKDVFCATFLLLGLQCLACAMLPEVAWFFISYWACLVTVYVGLTQIRRTKSWFLWWAVKKILPFLTCLYALHWPAESEKLARGAATLLQFLIFTNQGYLQQLVFEYEQMHFINEGRRNCMVPNLIFTVFFIALCAPTSGKDDTPFHTPVYDDYQSGLALLATIGNWMAIQITDGYTRVHYQRTGNQRMYFHFNQFSMIFYLFHFIFVIIATTWITSALRDTPWSYPLCFAINVIFTAFMTWLVYWLFLYFKATRTIFGLRQFNPAIELTMENEQSNSLIEEYRGAVEIQIET